MRNGFMVDFSPLAARPVDPVGDFVNAFSAGQALARRGAATPEPATSPVGQGDSGQGDSGQGASASPGTPGASAGPDPVSTLAAITRLSGPQREAARRTSEQLSAVLLALQGEPDGAARLAMARHAAPALGLDPQAVSPADVSDAGLAAHRAQAVMLQHLLSLPGAARA